MPITLEEYERFLDAPALCEQLRIRDLLDNVAIQVDGSFVAAYELSGLAALYASDEERNRNKQAIEALIRSLPERSLRMQMRFEITEGVGDLLDRHNREQRNPSAILHAIDQGASSWPGRNAMAPETMCVTFCMPTSSGTPAFTINPLTSSGNTR